MGGSEVEKCILLSELVRIKEHLEKALNPEVTFSNDMDAMREERDDYRENSLRNVIAWFEQKIY